MKTGIKVTTSKEEYQEERSHHGVEFSQVVLYWRSGQNDTTRHVEDIEHFSSFTISRLQPVTFMVKTLISTFTMAEI